ncbi:hypothetical protein B0H66DRAFT_565763 [Apodospora peruviana]|uniref:DUF6594 domain-containing protein n=1 Tax=Apodospora peruviana TaxID=516989 RepID=A0AAE0HVD3_9PEZI|nr:hypothetical protein B0H66DRAFT_565763 [Apodospora peruviana]
MNELALEIATIEDARAKLKDMEADSDEAKSLLSTIDRLTEAASKRLLKAMNETTSGITKAKEVKERQALWARIFMALGGGLSLVGPMLIMVLHPTKLTALTTTSCFVTGIAVVLAVFMRDSQPKDVVACTAAYAAVLVVFVRIGGGSSG